MGKKRNKKEIVEGIVLERYAAEGKSVGHLPDGKTIFVTGAVPGDEVQVLVLKNKSAYAEGNALKITMPSADRVEPFCQHFGVCGGCKWQMLPYAKQLEYKQVQVNDQLHRLAKIELPEILPIIGCEQDRRYRNKLEFTFSELRYLSREELTAAEGKDIPKDPVLGFHAPGMWDKVVDIDTCHLMQEPTNEIKNWLRSYTQERGYAYYNARTQEGWLRNVVMRISHAGSVLINLIVSDERPELQTFMSDLLAAFPNITSLHYTINDKVNDAIYDLPVHTYHGAGFIEEYLEDFKFKISPKSFFQTNSQQAERLYQVVREFAGLTGAETVYDMYCGTGSIGIFLSAKAGKVIGIDAVGDAILDAAVNAEVNGLTNTHFVAGDVIKIVNPAFFETHGRPDVIITDPPRAGMHQKMVDQLLEIAAPRIVYVSCNPATQARDLQLLDAKYKVLSLQPVDMFPQTHHIETVALLELK